MADRKPTPPTQASIAQGFISPYELANLGKPPFEEKPNRGEQISLKDSEPYDDATQDFTIGLQDVDEALLKHINDTIKPSVVQNGNRIEVPTIYGSPERWKSMQADGYYRDKNGKLMYPLIVVKRDNVIKDRTLGRKLDGNRVRLYKEFENQYTPRNRYDDISKIENRMPVREYSIVAIPDYVNISYSGVIYTNFVDQMNNLVEAFNFASDSYWGDKERFMFRTRIDSFSTFTEANQGEDRAIRAEFTMTVYGYLIPDTINKDLATLKKTYSKAQIRLEGEKSFDYFNLNNAINVIQQLPPSTTCANSTVQLNGTTIGTIASGETGDFPVTQNGSPVGSWNGSAWIVPPCATPSLSIEVYSDAGYTTPASSFNYGATAYIKLVPTGITPTSYTFFFGNGTKNAPQVTQAGDTLAWTISLTGSVIISATATDGTDATADATPFTLTSTLVIDHALKFDGVNDYATAIPIVENSGPLSFTFRFKLNDITRNNGIFQISSSVGRTFMLGIKPTSVMTIQLNSFPIDIPISLDLNWHHFTITYGALVKVYLDGILVYTGAPSVLFARDFDRFDLGVLNGWQFVTGANVFGNINVADFAFHDVELNSTQVTALQTLGAVSGHEVVRWPFSEPIGTVSGKLTDIVSDQKMSIRNMTSGFGIITY
jgi:hypothetical protein